MPIQHSILAPPDGRYLTRIFGYLEDENCYLLDLDIVKGPYMGFAHSIAEHCKQWPIQYYISKRHPKIAEIVQYNLSRDGYSRDKLCSDVVGHMLVVELQTQTVTIDSKIHTNFTVRRSYPTGTLPLTPDDYTVPTGSWADGSPDRVAMLHRAYLLPGPPLYVDIHEKTNTDLWQLCREKHISVVVEYFAFGDYRTSASNIVVDRKQTIKELADNFYDPDRRDNYVLSAQAASLQGKQLIYLVGTTELDGVQSLDDITHWEYKDYRGGKEFDPTMFGQILRRHSQIYPHVSFRFYPQGGQSEETLRLLNIL